jgi:hypothetical protein
MNTDLSIQALKDSGFNIFASACVASLTSDLFPFTDIQKTKTLCLIGNGGRSLWEKLPHPLNIKTHPIDQYSKNQIHTFSESIDSEVEILFPNDHYTLPLQRIGRALNVCTQSPIGLDVHPSFGLWFAIRGVFLVSKKMSMTLENPFSPCNTCTDKPCMKISDIAQARMKCPFKNEHQYTEDQIRYHQNALELI